MLAEFIHETGRATSQKELAGLFLRALEQYGYECFHYLSRDGVAICEFMNGQPHLDLRVDWYREYIRKGFNRDDALLKVLPRTRVAFSYQDLQKLPLSERQKKICGFRENLFSTERANIMYVPISSPGGKFHGMALCALSAAPRCDQDAVSVLHALCNQMQLCLMHLEGNNEVALPDIDLSPRETEVLKWCAQGKNNGDIGDILKISDKTVEFHMQSAFGKLKVNSRTTAVLTAVQHGLIH